MLIISYYFIILSYYSYCLEICGGTYHSIIGVLILQKHAIYVVCKSSKYDYADILLFMLSTLKLRDIKYIAGILMCKKRNVIFKCYFSEELIALNTLHEVVPTW